MKKNPTSLKLSHGASLLLHIGLPIVLLQLILISAYLIFGEHENIIYAVRQYQKMLEYIFLDIVVLLGGALLFEVADRDARR